MLVSSAPIRIVTTHVNYIRWVNRDITTGYNNHLPEFVVYTLLNTNTGFNREG
jgi:hypothetical protein